MKTGEKVLLGSAAAVVAALVFSKISALKNLVFSPGRIIGLRFDGATPVLSIIINIDNTSPASITVNSFSGLVYANNVRVGQVTNFYPTVIAGGQRTPLQIDIAFELISLTNNIVNAFSYGNYTEQLKITGSANAEGTNWPVNIDFTVGGK